MEEHPEVGGDTAWVSIGDTFYYSRVQNSTRLKG